MAGRRQGATLLSGRMHEVSESIVIEKRSDYSDRSADCTLLASSSRKRVAVQKNTSASLL